MLGKRKSFVRLLFYLKNIKKITVIIPTFNNLENLQRCVSSIQKQTATNYEVWIIDGDSSDGTKAFLTTLKAPFYWVSESDKGIYDAMNKGINLSKGEWLYFLGADDELFNADVFLELSKLNILDEISIITGKVQYHKDDIPFIYSKKKKIKNPSWNFSMWIRNGLHHQGTLYKRKLFKKNQFDVQYKVLADYAFNLNAYKKKVKCLKINMIIAECSGKGVSKSGTWALYKEEYLLKVKESSWIFGIFHYLVITVKFLLRKRINL